MSLFVSLIVSLCLCCCLCLLFYLLVLLSISLHLYHPLSLSLCVSSISIFYLPLTHLLSPFLQNLFPPPLPCLPIYPRTQTPPSCVPLLKPKTPQLFSLLPQSLPLPFRSHPQYFPIPNLSPGVSSLPQQPPQLPSTAVQESRSGQAMQIPSSCHSLLLLCLSAFLPVCSLLACSATRLPFSSKTISSLQLVISLYIYFVPVCYCPSDSNSPVCLICLLLSLFSLYFFFFSFSISRYPFLSCRLFELLPRHLPVVPTLLYISFVVFHYNSLLDPKFSLPPYSLPFLWIPNNGFPLPFRTVFILASVFP